MGLAMGFGKEILILQELPIEKRMIDLQGVVREYSRESELKAIVQEWIEKQKRFVTSYRGLLEKSKSKEKPQKLVTLQGIGLWPFGIREGFPFVRLLH